MKFRIKQRQLRKQYDTLKLKAIGNEMFLNGDLGLKVEKTKLGIKSLAFLENYKHLESLSIHNISKDITMVSQLINLKEIALCGLTLQNLDFLKSLPNLEYLWLQGSRIKNLDSFRDLKYIKALKLFKLQKLDNLDYLNDMRALQYINIDSCSNIVEFPKLSDLKQLRRVFIDTTKRLNNISGIAKAPNLKELIVINAKELPINCFDDFFEHKSIDSLLIGVDLTSSKKYKEIEKRVPEKLKMNGYYGTKNEEFEII